MGTELISFADIRRIVPEASGLETLYSGLMAGEGPVWQKSTQTLFFTDFPALRIYCWRESEGIALFRENSGRAVGLTLDAQDRLLACEGATRAVTRLETDGTRTVLASHFNGHRVHSPNDLVVRSDATLYFTDPYSPYLKPPREMEWNGVYMVNVDSGEVSLLADDFRWPNGIALSPDESLLYVNDTERQHIRVFDVSPDGKVANGRVFAAMDPSFGGGVADGMKVDAEGNVYSTGPGGIWIFSPEGERIGIIKLPEMALNLGWGGKEGKSLFITATTTLYRIELAIPGIMAGS